MRADSRVHNQTTLHPLANPAYAAMPHFPLVSHATPDRTIAWRDGAPVSVRAFLADVYGLAAVLPEGGHVFNVCKDRYRFAVGLCAALLASKVSLLPSSHTPQTVRQLKAFAPDAFCLHDTDDCTVDLPRFRYPHALMSTASDDAAAPQIDGARVMAYVFTSGSTGEPVPHRKTWGFLVKNVRAAAARLGLACTGEGTLVGTVPPQHMYGFESTVLLALIGGLAFSNGQPFYPGDIRGELEAVPAPRILVTSPIHLRALLASEPALPRTSLILSATAPLAEKLAVQAEARFAAPLVEIYGSTETGQIATRRTSRGAAWELFPEVTLTVREAAAGDEDGDEVWAAGGHVEAPVRMGDALELIDDTHFLLHGRKADLINIAGKRTSLAYLNHQLMAIAGVDDGAFFMPDEPDRVFTAHDAEATPPIKRLVALVVAPTLSPSALQRSLRERIDAAFMPRPLLFVDSLPRNGTGKLPRDVLAPLVAALLECSADATVGGSNEHKGDANPSPQNDGQYAPIVFEIAPDHPALPGHFPGRPIVPGVVLLDCAIERIGAALGRPLDACKIGSAKFTSPAAAGEPLTLTFSRDERGTIRFTISAGERTTAVGVLTERQAP
jgi:acyl-coenzyme A synthetase/AMP-(fatty) acid ligase/3-hydroxymyristoyl/3-hydroxydecanoyl-(acyl carrier protein) dehydratase